VALKTDIRWFNGMLYTHDGLSDSLVRLMEKLRAAHAITRVKAAAVNEHNEMAKREELASCRAQVKVLSGALQELKGGTENGTPSPAEDDRVGMEAVLRGVKQQFKQLRREIEGAPRRAWEEWTMLAEVRRA
jgi:hypothetical protein